MDELAHCDHHSIIICFISGLHHYHHDPQTHLAVRWPKKPKVAPPITSPAAIEIRAIVANAFLVEEIVMMRMAMKEIVMKRMAMVMIMMFATFLCRAPQRTQQRWGRLRTRSRARVE